VVLVLRLDELGANAKLILVMDSSILSHIRSCIPGRVIRLATLLIRSLRHKMLPIVSAVA
jgi:hypothetical protein